MNDKEIVINVENISKCYRIGVKEVVHDTFARTMIEFIKSPLKNYRKYSSLYKFDDIQDEDTAESVSNRPDIIWALKDLCCNVKKGEVLGIIGNNGSGKSTLLKILSRITYPTKGSAEIRGTVSSLLEVGTGFNSELTGRENVYLNGTILGMKKKEVDRKFDAIVDFSGVEKFIDTPVKRYSSGMTVRLAFAVAAHLEPEILIIDEVLAVGDAEFQAKCIGKMNKVAKEGRTILFVSHNMGAITGLCSRVIWLDRGKLKLDGPPMDVVGKYLSSGAKEVGAWNRSPSELCSGRLAWLRHARVLSGYSNKVSTVFRFDEQVKIEIAYEIKNSVRAFRSYLWIKDFLGHIVWASHDTDGTEDAGKTREPGIYTSTCVFPECLLRPGQYFVSVGIYGKPRETVEEELVDVMSFNISEAGYSFSLDPRFGLITPHLSWNIARQPLECGYVNKEL